MPDLRLRVVADDRATRLLDSVSSKLDIAGRSGEKFGSKVEKGSRKVDKSLKKVAVQAKKTAGAFSRMGGIMAGVFTAAVAFATIRFLKDSLELLSIQEQAVNDLALAMKNLGVFTESALKEQERFASEVQKVTVFGDEQILGLQALLTTFGLYGKELQGTTIATIDLATALGVDLKAAAILLGKAFIGETSSLSRYGIIIDKNIPKSEKFAEVIKLINRQFGGAAQAQTKTYAGAVKQLSNNFGDLQENIAIGLIPASKLYLGILNRSIDAVIELFAAQTKGTTIDEITVELAGKKIKALNDEIESMGRLAPFMAGRIRDIKNDIRVQGDIIRVTKERIALEKQKADAEAKAAVEKKRLDLEEQNRIKALADGAKERAAAEQEFATLTRQLSIERLEADGKETEAKRQKIEIELEDRRVALQKQFDLSKQTDDAILNNALANADAIAKARKEDLEDAEDEFKKFEGVANAVGSSIEQKFAKTFAGMLLDGKTFSEQMKFFFKDLARVAISQLTRIAVHQALIKAGITGATGGFGPAFGIPLGPAPGSFAHGTQRVPGPIGTPVAAIVHGGEEIRPAGFSGGGGSTTIVQNITQNIRVNSLGHNDREIILNDLAKSFTSNTDAARNFASESELAAERNAGLSS